MATKTEAETAWAALDRRTRREVWRCARAGRVPADGAVASVATRYARAELTRGSRIAGRVWRKMLLMLCAVVVAVAYEFDTSGQRVSVPVIPNLIFAVLFIVAAFFTMRTWVSWYQTRLLARIAENWPSPSAGPAQPAARAGELAAPREPGQSLEVRYAPRKNARLLAFMAGLGCFAIVVVLFQVFQSHGLEKTLFTVLLVIIAASFAFAVGAQIWTLARLNASGRAAVSLDDAGAHINAMDLVVPWQAVSEIGLFPAHGPSRPAAVVALFCADPAAVLDGIRLSWQRKRFVETGTRMYGTPFVISSMILDHTAEEIAAAASGLSGLPVRRR